MLLVIETMSNCVVKILFCFGFTQEYSENWSNAMENVPIHIKWVRTK